MASEVTVEVSVEAAIHKGLTEFAQHIFDVHGVMLDSVDLTWGHVTLGQRPQVSEAIIKTRTVYGAV
jgi:phosphosulfolactate synthase (CoM biosynthesis protein A)